MACKKQAFLSAKQLITGDGALNKLPSAKILLASTIFIN